MTSASDSTRRRYHSPRRQQQAADTRAAILAAATRLFSERGWAATSIRDVAEAAQVSVQAVYTSVGSKADLLREATDVAVVGDAQPVPLAERPEFAALGQGDARSRALAAARLLLEVQQRTLRLRSALREAAASDAQLAEQWRDNELRRRINIEQAGTLVAGRALSDRERDGLWAVCGIEVYQLLTELAGWTAEQYQDWMTDTILRLLDLTPANRRRST